MAEAGYVQKFEDLFSTKYKKELDHLSEFFPKQKSLNVDYKILEEFDIELADELMNKPYAIISAAQEAIANMKIINSNEQQVLPYVRFFNLPADSVIMVRDINSSHINKFIALEGVITKITEVKPKITVAVFQCNHCGRIYKMPQNSPTEGIVEPGVCSCERRSYKPLPDQSEFIDNQKMGVQEPLEKTRGGDQTRKMDIILEDDLTNKLTPGDKVMVTGVLLLQPPKDRKTVYDMIIQANYVEKIEKEFEELDLTEQEKKEIIEISKDPDLYKNITLSIAPSIYGHMEIKEAIAMQLFGGTPRKVKLEGIKIRPDMHILLIGDPGTAKSQLLNYVKNLAPKGIYVSGKSSSAAGLTATAEKDDFGNGGWTLKAGALVLAAGGMAMVDEFDKMSEEDRSSMHEAMESQEIHVAKAGMIATFKANSSILAAANPKLGRFDPMESPAKQFNIPPTIMSRFDLIFAIKDVLDEKIDSALADKVLGTHLTAAMKLKKDYNKTLVAELEKQVTPVINPDTLRKYIAYARRSCSPILTEEAMEKIKDFYVQTRKKGEGGAVPITARYLEGIVRLSEASAKARLSESVDLEDAERAIRLLMFSLRQIGLDPETGKIDIDIIATGTSKSKVDKIKTVLKIIRKLDETLGEAKFEAIIEEAKNDNIKEAEVEDIVQTLNRNGDIFKPRYGTYKITKQQKE